MSMDISDKKAITWLNKFYLDKNVVAIKDLYSNGSYNEILAVGRKEASHSSFLSWLFDMNGSHGLQGFALLQLLKIVLRRGLQQRVKSELGQFMAEIYNEKVQFNDMTVSKEVFVNTGRTDIEIRSSVALGSTRKNLHIIIENKVKATERENQTQKYYDYYSLNLGKDDCLVGVFLSPKHDEILNAQNKPSCSCKEFVEINYQDILSDILEPALQRSINERVKFIIKEYIRCLGMPIADIDNKQRKKTIMATSNEVRDMLKAFWDEHNELLIAVMETIANDPEQDNEVREKASALSSATVSAGKDKTHYEFNDKLHKGKSALIAAVISFLTNQKVTVEEICQKWQDFINSQQGTLADFGPKGDGVWTIDRHQELTKEELAKEHNILKAKSHPFVYDFDRYNAQKDQKRNNHNLEHNYSQCSDVEGMSCFYYNQWSWKNIDYFIKFYRECYQNKYNKTIELRY